MSMNPEMIDPTPEMTSAIAWIASAIMSSTNPTTKVPILSSRSKNGCSLLRAGPSESDICENAPPSELNTFLTAFQMSLNLLCRSSDFKIRVPTHATTPAIPAIFRPLERILAKPLN